MGKLDGFFVDKLGHMILPIDHQLGHFIRIINPENSSAFVLTGVRLYGWEVYEGGSLLCAGESTGLEAAIDGARHMWLSGGVLRF